MKDRYVVTDEFVEKLRTLHKEGVAEKDLARLYGISRKNIDLILAGENYGILYYKEINVAKEFEEGVRFADLEIKYDLTTKQLKKLIASYGVDPSRKVHKAITEEVKAGIVEDYKNGYTSSLILKKYHIGYKTFKKIMDESGCKMRPRSSVKMVQQ